MIRRPPRSTLFPLHDALPILQVEGVPVDADAVQEALDPQAEGGLGGERPREDADRVRVRGEERERSEEHTSELQSRQYLVCRLLLEKKKKMNINNTINQYRMI